MSTRNQAFFIIAIITTVGLSIAYLFYRKPAELKKNFDTIIVGTNAEYPPFAFIQDDTVVGFDIDIVQEVVKRLGKEIEIQNMSFDALLPALQLGSIHILAAGMSPTEEREKRFFFTKPHLTADPLIIVTRKDGPAVKNVDDLKNKDVVVNEGFTADLYVSEIQDVNIMRLANVSGAFLALTSKRADAFVVAKSAAQPFFDRRGTDNFVTTVIPGTQEQYALAISKKYEELLPQVQQALDAMKQDGTLTKLKKKWNLE